MSGHVFCQSSAGCQINKDLPNGIVSPVIKVSGVQGLRHHFVIFRTSQGESLLTVQVPRRIQYPKLQVYFDSKKYRHFLGFAILTTECMYAQLRDRPVTQALIKVF